MTCELRLSAGSCVYTNASIRLLLAFSLNKQSRRRRSDFHRAASIFLHGALESSQTVTCELRLSAGSCVYTNASIRLLLAFSLNKQSRRRRSDFHRAASIFLHGALESSSKSCRSDQPTVGLSWHGAEHGYPNRAGPASFHLGTEPSTTHVNIPARADWCLSPRRQRACGRQLRFVV